VPRRVLRHLGIPHDSRVVAHGARLDLQLVIGRLTDDELEAQRAAWTSVLENYKQLRRRGKNNSLVWALHYAGGASSLLGGIALLAPSLTAAGVWASAVGAAVVCASGAWHLLSLRWKRQAETMVLESQKALVLIASETIRRTP
jgi:hypothetical protein